MSVSLRKSSDPKRAVTQCEGCYDPLGSLLDAGVEYSELNITWDYCNYHYEPISNVPFDVYDDYNERY